MRRTARVGRGPAFFPVSGGVQGFLKLFFLPLDMRVSNNIQYNDIKRRIVSFFIRWSNLVDTLKSS